MAATVQPGGEIILYQRGDARAIDVRLGGETVWLSQQQLADLFQTSRINVVEHIANIYAEGELSQGATCREFRQVRTEGSSQRMRAAKQHCRAQYSSDHLFAPLALTASGGSLPNASPMALAQDSRAGVAEPSTMGTLRSRARNTATSRAE